MTTTREGYNSVVTLVKYDKKPTNFRLHVAFIREDDGRISVEALNLPGVLSYGATEREAMDRIKEAARGAVATYVDEGEDIPWLEEREYDAEPDNMICKRWIMVDA